MEYTLPYGKEELKLRLPSRRVIFDGAMGSVPGLPDLEKALMEALNAPIGSPSLAELAQGKENIVFLVEDATRNTPLDVIMPVVTTYLNHHGVPDRAMSFLTAPGTHRIMTEEEILQKLGADMVRRFKVRQHDALVEEDMADLGHVDAGGYRIPIHVNRHALGADLLVGLGNIVPHSDAGFSGGAKIVQPGICDFVTTSATHAAAGFCPDIPLGVVDNPCRQGMEEVAKKAGLAFIINVVQNSRQEVVGIFAGDCIEAHRAGVALAEKVFRVEIPELADLVVVSSSPADLDYWQALKGVTSAYFAVKEGGIILFAAPCEEGLAHNHPHFRKWLSLPLKEVLRRLKAASPEDVEADMVSAVLAVCNCRVRDKARVFSVTSGLTEEDIHAVGYTPFGDIQAGLDEALRLLPEGGTIGILPKGGIALPRLKETLQGGV